MSIRVLTGVGQGTASQVTETILREVRSELAEAPALLAVFASTQQPLTELVPPLAEAFADTVVLGASTAGEFTEKGDVKGGVTYLALSGDLRVHAGLGTDLQAEPMKAVAEARADQPEVVEGFPHRTGILLLDPLAGNGEETVLSMALALGPSFSLAGGAAGDDLHMAATQVALGNRVASDALVLATVFSRTPLGIGVCHGHRPLSGPLTVTRAEGSVVYEVEGRPAWDVWREETREDAKSQGLSLEGTSTEEENAFLLRYEAGLAVGEEYKVRAPLSRDDDGSIHFATGVPEGSVIQITRSSTDLQVESARRAARAAREELGGRPVAGALVFDCICRNLILGPRFGEAVRGMSEELGGAPLAGFETYGEIALAAGDLSGFHNTTTVVLAFPGEDE